MIDHYLEFILAEFQRENQVTGKVSEQGRTEKGIELQFPQKYSIFHPFQNLHLNDWNTTQILSRNQGNRIKNYTC